MMGHILNLMRWEWFKLRKRWMPWFILAIILLFAQVFGVWSNFVFYRISPSSEGYADLKLPQALVNSVTVVCGQVSVILIIILTASVIGTDYGARFVLSWPRVQAAGSTWRARCCWSGCW